MTDRTAPAGARGDAARQCLVVALDVDGLEAARRLARAVAPCAGWLKVGSTLFTREGPRACAVARESGARVFLDLKFHDIPNTVAGAVRAAADLGVDMLTVHASGGPAMIARAREAAAEAGREDLVIVAVTVLTSFAEGEFGRLMASSRETVETVVALARTAVEAGADGVVASAREVGALRTALGPRVRIVTPGVRLPGDARGDQARVVTPADAIRAGSTQLVVGRPISAAPDPAVAARAWLHEIEGALRPPA